MIEQNDFKLINTEIVQLKQSRRILLFAGFGWLVVLSLKKKNQGEQKKERNLRSILTGVGKRITERMGGGFRVMINWYVHKNRFEF